MTCSDAPAARPSVAFRRVRREVQAIAPLFDRKDVFLGSDASEQLLADLQIHGQLSQFSVIHLAAHGRMDDLAPMNSRLLLSQDRLPDPTKIPRSTSRASTAPSRPARS